MISDVFFFVCVPGFVMDDVNIASPHSTVTITVLKIAKKSVLL